jgi:glyoxylase-like metal-dependent hydrolase (beta-lactamase superfamily II)
VAILVTHVATAMGQDAPAPIPVLKVERLSAGVAVVVGPGGNVTVGHGPDGVVLVDAEVAELSPELIAAVRTIDPGAIQMVIDTHWHFDHVGGNEALAKAGAVIVAQHNVQVRMASGGTIAFAKMTVPPAAKAAVPTRTFLHETSMAAVGDLLRLVHVPHAHTDGDVVVKWTRADVLDMGDVYVRYGLPFVDLSSGGSLRGLIRAADKGLALSGPRTLIVPGHGEPATQRDLAAYRDHLLRIASAVEAQVSRGKSLAEVQALRLADDWVQGSDAFVQPDEFVAMAYESSVRDSQHHATRSFHPT